MHGGDGFAFVLQWAPGGTTAIGTGDSQAGTTCTLAHGHSECIPATLPSLRLNVSCYPSRPACVVTDYGPSHLSA